MRKHDLKINKTYVGDLGKINRETKRHYNFNESNKALINELLNIVSNIALDEKIKEKINTYIAKNNTYSLLERKKGVISVPSLIETYYPLYQKL